MPANDIQRIDHLDSFLDTYRACDKAGCTTCGGWLRFIGQLDEYAERVGPLWEVLASVEPFDDEAATRFVDMDHMVRGMLARVPEGKEHERLFDQWLEAATANPRFCLYLWRFLVRVAADPTVVRPKPPLLLWMINDATRKPVASPAGFIEQLEAMLKQLVHDGDLSWVGRRELKLIGLHDLRVVQHPRRRNVAVAADSWTEEERGMIRTALTRWMSELGESREQGTRRPPVD